MSFNGSGTFTIDTPGNPVQADTTIRASVHNDTLTEIAAGLSNCICVDGQSTITQNLPFNNKRITNLQAGVSLADAITTQNLIANYGSYVASVGGTGDAITLTTFPTGISVNAGTEFWFIAASNNTGAVTVNINGLGVKNLTKGGTIALSASDIVAGALVGIMYDGTRFQLLEPAYAEGTWTPTLGGSATYTAQTGRWRKVGSVVSIWAKLIINTIGTGSTTQISGLPFPSFNVAEQGLTIGDFASLANNVVWLGARVENNASTITMRSLTAAGASTTSTGVFGNGTMIVLSGVYFI